MDAIHKQNFKVWIGGKKIDGPNPGPDGWVWVQTSQMDPLTHYYQNWAKGQPDNSYGMSLGEACLTTNLDRAWNDLACGYALPYICEIQAK